MLEFKYDKKIYQKYKLSKNISNISAQNFRNRIISILKIEIFLILSIINLNIWLKKYQTKINTFIYIIIDWYYILSNIQMKNLKKKLYVKDNGETYFYSI